MIKILIVLAIILCTLLFVKEIEDCCGGNDEIDLMVDGRIKDYEKRRDWEKRNDIK